MGIGQLKNFELSKIISPIQIYVLARFGQAGILLIIGDVMFNADKLVVYPAQGVGKIERIDKKNIGGVDCDFYIVRIRANNITLMVPVHNAANVGLRSLVSEDIAKAILSTLHGNLEQQVFIGQNWNRRFREYSERLKSSDLSVVSEVLRELLLIGRNKELSFGERRLLEQAMNLVSGELAEVLDVSADVIRKDLLERYAPQQMPEVNEHKGNLSSKKIHSA